MRKALILYFLLHFNLFLIAQNNFREGYIITLEKDTLFGELDFRNDIKNSKNCIFKDESNFIRQYNPYEIESYRFTDGKYYISKSIKREDEISQLFVEFLVKGLKDIFYYRDNIGFHYLIAYKNDTIVEIPYFEKIINKDSANYFWESKVHSYYLKEYFKDCEKISLDIEKINQPGFNNLILLTRDYHNYNCSENTNIEFYKPKPLLKIAIEPQFSIIKYKYTDNYAMQAGGLFYLWLPRSNENMYFKTGYLIAKFSDINKISRIPLQFEYLSPKRIVRPKFDFGISVLLIKVDKYKPYKSLTMVTSGGILIKLFKEVYLDLDIEIDLLQFTFETDFFISNSVRTGIYFKI
ncbi:MAG TPA: hypothetical protein DCG75_00895 [Bacteroidales bacterium]|nr:hypothetical protein [Bacteroidales bacterium]